MEEVRRMDWEWNEEVQGEVAELDGCKAILEVDPEMGSILFEEVMQEDVGAGGIGLLYSDSVDWRGVKRCSEYFTLEEAVREARKEGASVLYVSLNDYRYEGSATVETDPEDANGYLAWYPADIRKMYGEVTPATRRKARLLMASMVADLNGIVRNKVYSYRVEGRDGAVEDSCGGFCGEEYAREEAGSALERAANTCEVCKGSGAKYGVPCPVCIGFGEKDAAEDWRLVAA
jgi:hypothetical protein